MAKIEKPFILRKEKYPQIYVYSDIREPNVLKVGYTTRKNVEDRVKEQYGATLSSKKKPYQILWSEPAIKENGTFFTDKEVHTALKRRGIKNPNGEWFECSLDMVKAALIEVKSGVLNDENRTQTFGMRPEQQEAVNKTSRYFKSMKDSTHPPRFLWNAKMRFGKTFTTYQLVKQMNWSKILILTFKPAVESSWREDLNSHLDFKGWKFLSLREQASFSESTHPVVCFGSLQDALGTNELGEVKEKNKWIYNVSWDLVVFDEYHFGAWRDNTSDLFNSQLVDLESSNLINAKHFLYLSGTPFRAIQSGEFIEEQIYNWTYADEQRAKQSWSEADGANPYASLPQLMMLTYKLPDEIREVALKGQFNEFDLNGFFAADWTDEKKTHAVFKHENAVQKWLNLLRGALKETSVDNLELGAERPPFPFDDVNLLKILTHTLWYLPSVAACYAMKELIAQRQNIFYQDYEIVVAAGERAGVGVKALNPVLEAIGNPLKSKTITLTCGKLTTGVTVAPWTGIFMLCNLSTPESYFQSAFRVQSPWTIEGESGTTVLKEQCFVFDFAPERALKQLAEYCYRLDTSNKTQEKKIQDFINFLPVLAYDGFAMEQVDAAGLLDMAMGRTSATLLARGWNNALLINVTPDMMKSIVANDQAMQAIMSIEGFRNAKEDIGVIISKSAEIKKLKNKEKETGKLSKKEKKELTEAEKTYRKSREEVLNKLKIFATRIPLFMYLTDEREETLKEVITELEPALFKKVTGLTVKDFELLVSMGLFRENLMDIMVYNFRKYEDASMEYTGINRHEGEKIGLFATALTKDEYEEGI